MGKYTEDQKSIARALLKGPLDEQGLRSATGLPASDINEALKGMLKLGVVEKTGSPTKYKLIDPVLRGVEAKTKGGKFRLKMIIEGISESKESLQAQMDMLEQKLRRERYRIWSFEKADPVKSGNNWTSFFDVEISVPTMNDALYIISNYGPSSIELLEPSRVDLTAAEAQALLNDMCSTIHHYVTYIVQLKRLLSEKGKT